MENLIISGIISTTSNKQSTEFRVENPQKTAYLQLDEKNAKLLEEFGIQKYTSNNGDDFHCIKLIDKLKLYFDDSKGCLEFESDVNQPNFKTEKEVKMNIIKGEKAGNTFYRIQALKLDDVSDLVQIEAENPFA